MFNHCRAAPAFPELTQVHQAFCGSFFSSAPPAPWSNSNAERSGSCPTKVLVEVVAQCAGFSRLMRCDNWPCPTRGNERGGNSASDTP